MTAPSRRLAPTLPPFFRRSMILDLGDGRLANLTLMLLTADRWARLRASSSPGWAGWRIGGYALVYRLEV